LKHQGKNSIPEIALYSVPEEFISKTTPLRSCPLLASARRLRRLKGKRDLIISHPLRGGDEGEGDACSFTNERIDI
jgi:hypothetical protein